MSAGGEQATRVPVKEGDILAGKYRVERVLGAGAMGVVVAARHTDLHELRALKFMLPSALGDAEGVERFLREARAAARLKSQHVARVHDIGRLENGAPYIVMEYLDGRDLKSLLDERGRLAGDESARILLEACHALAEAHEAGIVHRDLKPANIFLSRGAGGATVVKVLDFGIAKMSDGAAGEMTGTQALLGTPLFMSPEQMRSTRNVDQRTDIWALGVILYRMLGGKYPFSGDTVTEICMSVISDEPEPLERLTPGVSPGLSAVVARCLSKNPAGRFSSIHEFTAALGPHAQAGSSAGFPVATAQPALPAQAPPQGHGTFSQMGGTHMMAQSAPSPMQQGPQGYAPPNPHGQPQPGYPQQAYPGQTYPGQTYGAPVPSTVTSPVGAMSAPQPMLPMPGMLPPQSSTASNRGLVAAVVVLGVLLVGAVLAGAFFLLRPGDEPRPTAATKPDGESPGSGGQRGREITLPGQTSTKPSESTATASTTKTTGAVGKPQTAAASPASGASAAPAATGSNLPTGAACAKRDQCTSGFCVDGVCCDSACTDKCMACTGAKKGTGGDKGTCGWISGGLDPDRECGGGDRRCDGDGACVSLTPEQIKNLGGK